MVPHEVITCLKKGGVGTLPTDTLYGVVGSALSRSTVARIYRVRKRPRQKPLIVLIASPSDLKKFGVRVSPRTRALLRTLWPRPSVALPGRQAGSRGGGPRPSVASRGGGPGPVTVIIPSAARRFAYLYPGSSGISFRVPKPAWLRTLLKKTGPLVAPSANISGKPPARTVREAFAYFGGSVDFYLDQGVRAGAPSSLIEIKR